MEQSEWKRAEWSYRNAVNVMKRKRTGTAGRMHIFSLGWRAGEWGGIRGKGEPEQQTQANAEGRQSVNVRPKVKASGCVCRTKQLLKTLRLMGYQGDVAVNTTKGQAVSGRMSGMQ